jgi:hypothetical protein
MKFKLKSVTNNSKSDVSALPTRRPAAAAAAEVASSSPNRQSQKFLA